MIGNMSNKKYCKLIMVAINDGSSKGASQSNKFYEMEWDGNSSHFNVKFGRVESTSQSTSYPISMWDKKKNEKEKKGYKDVTSLIAKEVKEDIKDDSKDLAKIKEASVEKFVSLMRSYTNGLVSKTYSVKSDNVTEKQIDEAQRLIDLLTKVDKTDTKEVNRLLLELYTIIPRFMSNVKSMLLPAINLDKVVGQEQDNIDAMSSQVKQNTKATKSSRKVNKEVNTFLDVLGITMKEIKPNKDLEYLVNQINSKPRIESVFEVNNPKEDKIFEAWLAKQKDKTTRILIHGTRCSSVIPILEIGLKIRPAGNFQFSGKVYGNGNYFSETVVKSLGYTGYDNDKVLLVYEVHTGNPFTYDGWYRGNNFSLEYSELQKRGFDSTFVKAGNGLLNSEIIAYKEEQCRIRYIIYLKN